MDNSTEDNGIIGTAHMPIKLIAIAVMEDVTPLKADEATDSVDIKMDIPSIRKDEQMTYTPVLSGANTQTESQSDTVYKPVSTTSPQEIDIKSAASISIKQEHCSDPHPSLQCQAVRPQAITSSILVKKTYTKLSQGAETWPNMNIGAYIKTEEPGSSTIMSRVSYKKPVTLNLSKMPKCFVLLEKFDGNQKLLNSTTQTIKGVTWQPSVVTSGVKLTPKIQRVKEETTVLQTPEIKLNPILNTTPQNIKQEPLVVAPMVKTVKLEPGLVAIDILEAKQGSSEQIMRCDKCRVKFDNIGELIDHNNVCHVKKTDTVKVNSCSICGVVVYSMAHLHVHMKSHLSVNIKTEDESTISQEKYSTTYICDICSKKDFKSQQHLLAHFKSCHKKIYNTPGFRLVKRFSCKICGKVYNGLHSASDHAARRHLPLLGHTLPINTMYVRFTNEKLNVTGFLTNSQAKSFTCKICGIELGCKQKAAMHMLDVHCY